MDYQGWLVVEQDVLPSLGTPRASMSAIARTCMVGPR